MKLDQIDHAILGLLQRDGRLSNVELSDDSSVVILARRQNVERETESGFVDCVKKSMLKGSAPVPLASQQAPVTCSVVKSTVSCGRSPAPLFWRLA